MVNGYSPFLITIPAFDCDFYFLQGHKHPYVASVDQS